MNDNPLWILYRGQGNSVGFVRDAAPPKKTPKARRFLAHRGNCGQLRAQQTSSKRHVAKGNNKADNPGFLGVFNVNLHRRWIPSYAVSQKATRAAGSDLVLAPTNPRFPFVGAATGKAFLREKCFGPVDES